VSSAWTIVMAVGAATVALKAMGPLPLAALVVTQVVAAPTA
jgi:hypothetical protein